MTTKVKITDVTGASGTFTLPISVDAANDPPVVPPAPTFTASASSIIAGQGVTLSWNCPMASGIYASWMPPPGGVTGPSNSYHDTPPVTTTYTLKVTYPGQLDVILTQTVTVVPYTPPPADTQWHISYYASADLSGAVVLQNGATDLNFNWGTGAPGTGVPSTNFSLRAVRAITTDAATYFVKTTSDDGARLYIDGKLILDHWAEQPQTDYSAYVDLTAGAHTITVEYFQKGGLAVLIVPLPVKATRPPPPPVNVIPLLGVNTIGNARAALDAGSRNCRAFLCTDNGGCHELKARYPDAIVVWRILTNNWTLTGDQLAGVAGGADDGLWYELYNEGDNWPYGDVKQISDRINNELQAANILLAKGARVMFGGYSMGCPGFTNPAICEQVARYAPLYNGNPKVAFSMHPYSPTKDHIYSDDALIWYERRWEYLFTACGFNPDLRKIFFSEMGIDDHGGFLANGLNDEQLTAWIKRWQVIQSRPVTVNGVAHPSPVMGGAIFQYGLGGDPKWLGYDVTNQIGVIQKAAWS